MRSSGLRLPWWRLASLATWSTDLWPSMLKCVLPEMNAWQLPKRTHRRIFLPLVLLRSETLDRLQFQRMSQPLKSRRLFKSCRLLVRPHLICRPLRQRQALKPHMKVMESCGWSDASAIIGRPLEAPIASRTASSLQMAIALIRPLLRAGKYWPVPENYCPAHVLNFQLRAG